LRQVRPSVGLQQTLVVALKGAKGLCLVKDARACSDELLVKLTLMVAAQPALAVQGLEPASALVDSVERAHADSHTPALAEVFHRAHDPIGFGWAVRGVVCEVKVLEGEHLRYVLSRDYVCAEIEKNKRFIPNSPHLTRISFFSSEFR
jgi:hypothetical protein